MQIRRSGIQVYIRIKAPLADTMIVRYHIPTIIRHTVLGLCATESISTTITASINRTTYTGVAQLSAAFHGGAIVI